MQPIHLAAMIGCQEILKYIGTFPGVDPNAAIGSAVKYTKCTHVLVYT